MKQQAGIRSTEGEPQHSPELYEGAKELAEQSMLSPNQLDIGFDGEAQPDLNSPEELEKAQLEFDTNNLNTKPMEKGKKTEALNKTIQAQKQEGVAVRLQTHVDKITGYFQDTYQNWLGIGEELTLIQAEGDYAGTFEQFVKTTFGKTRDWAYKFMQGFEAKKLLPANVEHEIQNPRQALALAAVPFEKREKVIAAVKESVKESGGKMTAKAIEKEAAKQKIQEADVTELDDLGNKIPNDILPEWNRAKDESKEARNKINEVARWFRDGLGDGEGKKRDPIFRAVALTNKKLFDDIKRQIAMVDPYAVCPTCKGTTKKDGKKCSHCKGTGFISKFEYENSGKKETKPKAKKAK